MKIAESIDGFIDTIEKLQKHPRHEVYEKVMNLLTKHLGC